LVGSVWEQEKDETLWERKEGNMGARVCDRSSWMEYHCFKHYIGLVKKNTWEVKITCQIVYLGVF